MARGPFQGTFVSGVRPTVVTAPDTLVYINGETETIGCPSCNRTFDLNKYITSVQIDLSIDSSPGSASISLSIPRHAIDDFVFDGNPVITPMMEVEIYSKGYYLVEGAPQYYPVFWGLVTEVGDSYSGGEQTFTIHCADILKWWELCKMSTNSAYTSPVPGSLGTTLFGNVFNGMNPFDMIWTLAQQSFGDVVVGTGSLTSLYREANQKATFAAAFSDLMLYWQQRFTRIRSNLVLYGVNGVAVRGDSLWNAYKSGKAGSPSHFASRAVALANGGGKQGAGDTGQEVYDPTDPSVVAMRNQMGSASLPLWQSEYETKLNLANTAKEAIGYEFYMDPSGDIVFKPPFFNLDIISNKPVSWIQDIDIIDWDLSESEAEVVTQIVMQGGFTGNTDWGWSDELSPSTSVTDYHLLRKYGWRSQNYNSEFMSDLNAMFYHGLDLLDRLNSRRHRASITIPMRPELRLGFPVYLAPKDQIWYIQGISHNIQFGGRATTTLTLTAKRSKFIAPRGIGTLNFTGFKGGVAPQSNPGKSAIQYTSRELGRSGQFDFKVGDAQTPPATSDYNPNGPDPDQPMVLRHPKTGRIVGFPNAVMVYTRNYKPTQAEHKQAQGIRSTPSPTIKHSNAATQAKILGTAQDQFDQNLVSGDNIDALREKHLTNRYNYGFNTAGVYTYAYDTSTYIQELLLMPASNIHPTQDGTGTPPKIFSGSSAMIRPVSDERGFEVIGHYRYGRGTALIDGSLVLNNGAANGAAQIDTQVALSGNLYETLLAQSQGLTSITSAYPNPADAIQRLQPEDLQTAAVQSNDTSAPQFTNTGTNFVDSAPLGSAAQQGLPVKGVEASQLSMALTLAEMTATKGNVVNDRSCPCLIGRADLAFMNIGYQIRTVNPSVPDNTQIFNQNPPGSITNAPINPTAGTNSGTQDDVKNSVKLIEDFLFNLYSALDGPHQEYEKEIRGDYYISSNEAQNAQAVEFNNLDSTDPLTPPFSAPNRFGLGSSVPQALQQLSTASNQLTSAWTNFGQNLQSATKRAQLTQTISSAQSQIASLKAQIASISSPTTVYAGNKPQTLANLNSELVTAEQNLANAQNQLSQIPST